MLWTIFVILLILWLLGVVSSYTLGGFIHILLVIAVVLFLVGDPPAGLLRTVPVFGLLDVGTGHACRTRRMLPAESAIAPTLT